MSSVPPTPLISATSAVIGAGTTVATALGTHLGPLSASNLTKLGAKAMDDAHAVINTTVKKGDIEQGQYEDFVVPDQERREFVTKRLTPLQGERDRLVEATQTFTGSFINWNSARKFCGNANVSYNRATALSSRKSINNTMEQTRPQEDTNFADEHANQMVSRSYDQRYPSANMGQRAQGEYNYPPVNGVRNNTTASSQQSYSTARTAPPSTTQRYTSDDVSESPVSLEGQSFANNQGNTYGSAQDYIHDSHRASSANAIKQYHSASRATDKKHTL